MNPIAFIVGVVGLIGYIVYSILKQVRKRKVHEAVAQVAQSGTPLCQPCRVQIYRDSSANTDLMRKWPYTFSLNNGEKRIVNDGCMIEFTTNTKSNALVGYGRSDYGGISKHPSLDSPFVLEAAEGGLIRLIAKPTFDYSCGDGKWKSNLEYVSDEA